MMISLQKTEITEFGNCGIQKYSNTETVEFINGVTQKVIFGSTEACNFPFAR